MRFSYIALLSFFTLVFIGIYGFFIPLNLQNEVSVEIPYGASISKTSEILKTQGIIRSKDSYILLIKIFHPKGIVAGKYGFSGNVSVINVAYRTSVGDFGREQVKLTIPEGFTNQEIVNRIHALFPYLTKDEILNRLPKQEGYIFPETYFFDKDVTLDSLVNDLTNKSNLQLKELFDETFSDSSEMNRILTIASLVEAEGRTKDERRIIAGIIENRLQINMPLQLDASLTYLTGRASSELTIKDLKMDSPFNTYVNTGLPPSPINNPGKESINAVLDPKDSDYLYYLHDKNGGIHYGKTYNEHLQNKNKYLR